MDEIKNFNNVVIVQNPSASQQYRADGFLSMIKGKIIKLKHPYFIIQINAVNKDMDVFYVINRLI